MKKTQSAIIFSCEVSEPGYKWTRNKVDGKLRLAPIEGRAYKEALSPGAFMVFANTDPTEQGIAGFASKFGHQLHPFGFDDGVGEGTFKSFQYSVGASLDIWQSSIATMQSAVHLWLAIRGNKKAQLRKVIRWEKNKGNRFVRYEGRIGQMKISRIIASSAIAINGTELAAFKNGDLLLPARYFLQRYINEQLERHPTIPFLYMIQNRERDPFDPFQQIFLRPPTLLAALWLQFAEAVTGNFELRKCAYPGCGRYYQVGPGVKRSDTATCSSRCRQRLSRKNREDKLAQQRKDAKDGK